MQLMQRDQVGPGEAKLFTLSQQREKISLPNAGLHIGMLVVCVRVRFTSPSAPPICTAGRLDWDRPALRRSRPDLPSPGHLRLVPHGHYL